MPSARDWLQLGSCFHARPAISHTSAARSCSLATPLPVDRLSPTAGVLPYLCACVPYNKSTKRTNSTEQALSRRQWREQKVAVLLDFGSAAEQRSGPSLGAPLCATHGQLAAEALSGPRVDTRECAGS